MWWEEFERRLTSAIAAYVKHDGPESCSPGWKLRTLLCMVQAEFLRPTKASITVEMNREPPNMTFEQALTNFRNEVNRKYPPTTVATRVTHRHIQAMHHHSGSGRGRSSFRGGRGQGRGGRG